MTPDELRFLDLTCKYAFHLYTGEVLLGNPQEEENEWYIINWSQSNRDKKPSEVGKKVIPSQIEWYEPIDTTTSNTNRKHHSITFDPANNCRILVIVGAGASYDYSFSPEVAKPPLAKDLFDDRFSSLITQFPGVESLCSQILQAPDVETYFQKQWDKVINSHNPSLLSKLIDVQFYLHFLFKQFSQATIDVRKNNYISFIMALHDFLIAKGSKEKAVFVSFNYDTILEASFKKALNYGYDSMEDYLNIARRFLLFKPHGSWNWVKKIDTKLFESLGLTDRVHMPALNQDLYRSGVSMRQILASLSEEVYICKDFMWNHYYFPQLLIPYRSKDNFVMPDIHTRYLEHYLDDIETIIVIGWKGTEDKFKELLKRKLGYKKITIVYVTAKDDTVENELKPVFQNATFNEFSPYENGKGSFTELNRFLQEYPQRLFEY